MTNQAYTMFANLTAEQAADLERFQQIAAETKRIEQTAGSLPEDITTDAEYYRLLDRLTEVITDDGFLEDLLITAKPDSQVSVIHWLPINGEVQPDEDTRYIFTDGNITLIGYGFLRSDKVWTAYAGDVDVTPTMYAPMIFAKKA